MKIIMIDARFATSPVGLGRYVRELVSRLVMSQQAQYILLVHGTDHTWLGEAEKFCQLVETSLPHYSLAEQIQLPRIIKAHRPDILFVPHFNVPVCTSLPVVMTVHDLILHRYPNEASVVKQFLYRTLLWMAVRKARGIITISEFVHGELQSLYGDKISQKVTVIVEGVSDHYTPSTRQECLPVLTKYHISTPYILYVGSAKEHKNVRLLLEAFAEVNIPDLSFVLVTGGKEASSLSPLPSNVHIISSVPETDLPALYSAASAFITASLYEGYGLPVAEALASGCPVIASNRTAIPEVANGHAVLIEPTKDGIMNALKNLPVLHTPYRAGSWDVAVDKTQALLLTSASLPPTRMSPPSA